MAHLLSNARLYREAREHLSPDALDALSHETLTLGPDLRALLGGARAERLQQLRDQAMVVALPYGRGYAYPAYQFDLDRGRLKPDAITHNQLHYAGADPWGAIEAHFASLPPQTEPSTQNTLEKSTHD